MKTLAAIVAALVVASPAAAQDFSMMSNWAQGQMLNDNLARNLSNATSPPTGRRFVAPRSPGASPTVRFQPRAGGLGAGTSYRADPAVSARVRRQFLAFVAKTSGQRGAAATAEMFNQADPLKAWARYAAPDGMRLGDVADAMAEYWVLNWMMAHRVENVPGPNVRAVRRQVSDILLSDPEFARLTIAQRQEMAEVWIYNTMFQGEVYKELAQKRDAQGLQRISDAAVARFRNEAHLDLRDLDLTGQGFIRRG